jgi:hypothetical protein
MEDHFLEILEKETILFLAQEGVEDQAEDLVKKAGWVEMEWVDLY